jgi:hypothetical protein
MIVFDSDESYRFLRSEFFVVAGLGWDHEAEAEPCHRHYKLAQKREGAHSAKIIILQLHPHSASAFLNRNCLTSTTTATPAEQRKQGMFPLLVSLSRSC